MIKIEKKELFAIVKKQGEEASVYAIDKDAPTQTVEVDNSDVKLEEVDGNNGKYKRLAVEIDKLGTQYFTVRGNVKDDVETFKLQVFKAQRTVPATGGRREITEGQQRVYAIPA